MIKALLLAAAMPIASAHATTYVNYYVGGAGASDANPGTSSTSPWATIAKVNGFRFPANSIINQQASLTGSLVLDGVGNAINATPANPITYIANQFTLTGTTSGSGSAAVTLNNVPVVFSGAVIRGTGTTNYGIKITGCTSGTVTGNDVGGFALDQTNGGTEILVATSGMITVSQNTVHGLAGATSHDDFGILSNGSTGNVTISGNNVYNIGGFAGGPGGYSGNGIEVDNSKVTTAKHLVANNLIHDIGGNTITCGGPAGIIAYNALNVTVAYNEVYNVQPLPSYNRQGCDWDGIDLDGYVSNSVVEYNYTHHNAGAGYLAWMGGGSWGNNSFRFNVSENDSFDFGPQSYFGSMALAYEGAANPVVYVYNNIFYQDSPIGSTGHKAAIAFARGGPAAGSVIANNIVAFTQGNYAIGCGGANANFASYKWGNNGYYAINGGANTVARGGGYNCGNGTGTLATWTTLSGEQNAIAADPLFAGPVPVPQFTWSPTAPTGPMGSLTGYGLTSGSSYLGAGVNPVSLGVPDGTDYYGTLLVQVGNNIGAF